MTFNPVIHTKYYLLNNTNVLFLLAENSEEFAASDLASDFEILSVSDYRFDNVETVAHMLARNSAEWVKGSHADNYDVLQLRDGQSRTVAHTLSVHQSYWLNSKASQDHEILKLRDESGWTVAHALAANQVEWQNCEAASNPEILKLKNIDDRSVAHALTFTPFQGPFINLPWLQSYPAEPAYIEVLSMRQAGTNTVAHNLLNYHTSQENVFPILFDKRILTLTDDDDELLAETIFKRYGIFETEESEYSLSSLIMKLISQGAAYKSKEVVTENVSQRIIELTEALIDDCKEVSVCLRYALALYSTLSQNVVKSDEKINKVELLVRNILNSNSYLLDSDIGCDINCEQGRLLINQIQAEHKFKSINYEPSNTETINSLTIY